MRVKGASSMHPFFVNSIDTLRMIVYNDTRRCEKEAVFHTSV